ncbi:hypothetical protein QQS21_002746 [Conoideocrella luteorostrata]|uniref:Uncharacterized protein n=1 Tax=Conoideocrella luteorostrata TaxID=1105319 RepID=A0AAJ0CYR7_9HYPO|nr:hypothetical protein QQS21_002746 [Conoideocrella luteorostrata]
MALDARWMRTSRPHQAVVPLRACKQDGSSPDVASLPKLQDSPNQGACGPQLLAPTHVRRWELIDIIKLTHDVPPSVTFNIPVAASVKKHSYDAQVH